MAKVNVSRTYGPIHFEDLDPHRFEDLVRELIYDYKDWQSIEATGRSGSDDGFDIGGYERISNYNLKYDEDNSEETEDSEHPMSGNLWMIQCKREKEIGPQRISNIISDCINPEAPPYGYILVASANFSKKSYDLFRSALMEKGIMEFYLWGKGELEDMLHMPKFDRILFTFFGISLLTRKRSRVAEVRSLIAIKNKLIKIVEDKDYPLREIFIRDINDSNYPNTNLYKDFEVNPRWKKYIFKRLGVTGLLLEVHAYYSYYDKQRKEWDYTTIVDLNNLYEEGETDEEGMKKMNSNRIVRDFWECLPKVKQSELSIYGIVRYNDILLIDEKGDSLNKLLHIYIDFNRTKGPFSKLLNVIKKGDEEVLIEKKTSKQIKIFPEVILESKVVDKTRVPILIDENTFAGLLKYDSKINALYDNDEKYIFLNQKDIIKVENIEKKDEPVYLKITNKYKMKIKDYLEENNNDYFLQKSIKDQISSKLNTEDLINVYEFERSYKPTSN